MTVSPLGAPRKGERKGGGGLKTQKEEVTRQTGLAVPCYLICTIPKEKAPTSDLSNKTLMEAFKILKTKPHPENKALVFLHIVVQTTLI